jgi:hypothetical protein
MNQSTMDMQAIQANAKFLGDVRLTSAVFSGIAAGILGLTNLYGFAFYYFIYLCATALLVVKVGAGVDAVRVCLRALGEFMRACERAGQRANVGERQRPIVVPHSASQCAFSLRPPVLAAVFV